jgi:serine/threonine-protein kinase
MSATQATLVPDSSTYTRIGDPRWLLTIRTFWVVLVGLALAVKIALIPYWQVEISEGASRRAAELAQVGLSDGVYTGFFALEFLLLTAAYLLIGLVVFWRRSNALVPIFIALALALNGLAMPSYYITVIQAPLLQAAAAVTRYLVNVVINTAIFVFPDGKFSIPWMRWLLLGYFVVDAIRIGLLVLLPRVGAAEGAISAAIDILFYLSLVSALAAVWSQVYRYRRASNAVQRQQTKWVVLGVAAAVLVEVITPLLGRQSVIALFATSAVTTSLQLALPLAVAFAILRYRLYDIDLIINRSLVYGLLTLILAAVFLGGAFILQTVLGQERSGSALVVALLIAGGLFNPVRRRVQNVIDRRLYGFRFDLNELKAAQQQTEKTNPGALTGRILGDYQVLDLVGRGGMGEVYRGYGNGQTVAIKILPPDVAETADFRIRFAREAETLAAFDHPNIVKMYASGESDGVYYMALEYVEGRDLSDIIRQNTRLTIDDIRPFVADFAAALDYAHARGLVHRDIKPSNIMIRQKPDGQTQEAVLMDFGVAKIQDARTSITGTSAIGTIDYMAPEQIMAAREVDHRADIYALGVVLYQMLTGELPFKGNPAQVLFAHLYQPAPDPRHVVPELPGTVAEAIMRAMAKQPEDRFQSVGGLAAALD